MSGPWVVAAVSVAGGVGATLRMTLDGIVTRRTRRAFPLGTLAINVTGSFVLGLVTSAAVGSELVGEWGLIAGTGLLGGYTTFSTASVETARMVEGRRWRAAIVNSVGMLAVSLLAAAVGLWVGTLV